MPSRGAARSAPKQSLAVGKKTLDAILRKDRSADLESRANAAETTKRRRKSPENLGRVVDEVGPEPPVASADHQQAFRIGQRVECCDGSGDWADWKGGTITNLSPLLVRRDGVPESLVWANVRRKQADKEALQPISEAAKASTPETHESELIPCIKDMEDCAADMEEKLGKDDAFTVALWARVAALRKQCGDSARKVEDHQKDEPGVAGNKRQRNTKHERLDKENANADITDSPISVAGSSPPKSEGDIDAVSSEQNVRDSSARSKHPKLSDEASCGTSGADTPPQRLGPARQEETHSNSPVKAVAMQHRDKLRAAKTCGRTASANPLHAAFTRASSTRQTASIDVDQSPEEKREDDNSPEQLEGSTAKADREGNDVDANLLRIFDEVEPRDAMDDDTTKLQNISSEQQDDCELLSCTRQMPDDVPEASSQASASQKTSLQLKTSKRLFGKTSCQGQSHRRGTMLAFAKKNSSKPFASRLGHQAIASCEESQGVAKDEASAANEEKSSEPGARSRDSHKQNHKQRKPMKLCFDSLKKSDAHVQDDVEEVLPEKREAAAHEDEPSATKQCLTAKKESSASSDKAYTMKRYFSKQKEVVAHDGEVDSNQPLSTLGESSLQDDRQTGKQGSSAKAATPTQDDDSKVKQRLMTLFQNNAKAISDESDGNCARLVDSRETKDVENASIDVDVVEAGVDPSKKVGKALPPGIDSLPPGVCWDKEKHLIVAKRRSDQKKLALSVRKMTIQSAIKLATEFVEKDNAALAEAERASRPKLWTDRHRPQHLKWIKCPCWEVLGKWLRSWSSGPPSKRAALVCGAVGVGKSTGAKLAIERSRVGDKSGERRLLEYDLKDKEGRTFVENLCKGQTTYAYGSLANTVVLLEVDGACRNFLTYMSRRVLKQSTIPIIIVCSDSSLVQDSGIAECCLRIEVPNQPTQQVADNLQRIASTESLTASPESWLVLAEACGGDLRRAVNSMQLLGAPSEAHELLDTVGTPQAACSRLLARNGETAPLSMYDRLALLSIDEQLLPLMVQENYLRACCIEDCSSPGAVSEDIDEDKLFNNLEICAAAADSLAWGDILGCAATTYNGDIELTHSALMMEAALPSALMAHCQLPAGRLADGTPIASPALRCLPPEVSQSGPHPIHWSAVNELTRQFGLPRERICAELLRWRRTVGKSREEPRKAPRDMAARLKRYTSALQLASSSAAEAALRENSEAGICSGSIYYIESLRSPGYFLDDGGNGVIRLTQGMPSEGNWAQFKLVLRSGKICNVESMRSPGYFLDDGGDGVIRLTQSAPVDDATWPPFRLTLKDDNVFVVESTRSPGYFLDDGGDGMIRFTQSSPGADDLWGQFKLVLYQRNQDTPQSIPTTPPELLLSPRRAPEQDAVLGDEMTLIACNSERLAESMASSGDTVEDDRMMHEDEAGSEDKVEDLDMKLDEQEEELAHDENVLNEVDASETTS